MQDSSSLVLIVLVVFTIISIFIVNKYVGKKPIIKDNILSKDIIISILDTIGFFNVLSEEDKHIFYERVDYFLRTTKISAEKGAIITDRDKVLLAASAIIPLFHFSQWAYENLTEVIIYPDTFNEKFSTTEADKNILGMVGDGALNHKMLISLHSLRAGFEKNSSGNTAIHEFVHLIDKADGLVDGVPEYLIPRTLIEPWLKEMHETIREIKNGESDIRAYASTNEAEFLAVVSEYFFKKPNLLKKEHPELYNLLDKIYTKRA